jgi:transposase
VEVIDNNLRYMLCKNPVMEIKEANTRKRLLKKTIEELDKIMKSTRKTKNPKGVRAGKVVNKYMVGKFVIFEGDDKNLSYRLDQAKIEEESQLDGCYIVFTDAPKEEMSTIDAVKTYKSLIQVEQAFRNLKTAALEVRPIFHKTDDRIKCHVFICMLAYYVMWHMRQRLQPLCETDGVGEDRKYTFEFIMKSLEAIRLESVDFMGVQTHIVSTPNEEQAQILNLLRVAV